MSNRPNFAPLILLSLVVAACGGRSEATPTSVTPSPNPVTATAFPAHTPVPSPTPLPASAAAVCGRGIVCLASGNRLSAVPFVENEAAEILPDAAPNSVNVRGLAARGDYLYALVDVGDSPLLSPSGSRPALLTWELHWEFGAPMGLLTVPFRFVDRQDLPELGSQGWTFAGDLDAEGNLLFLTTYDPGMLRIFDVSDPGRPRQVGEIELGADYTHSSWTPELDVKDGHAFVTANDELRVLDVRHPAAPRLVSVIDAPGDPMDGDERNDSAVDVAAAGDTAYVTSAGAGGLWVAEVNPQAQEWHVVGQIDLPDGQRRIAAVDNGRMWVLVFPSHDGSKPQPETIVRIDVSRSEAPHLEGANEFGTSWCRHLLIDAESDHRERWCVGPEGGGLTQMTGE